METELKSIMKIKCVICYKINVISDKRKRYTEMILLLFGIFFFIYVKQSLILIIIIIIAYPIYSKACINKHLHIDTIIV